MVKGLLSHLQTLRLGSRYLREVTALPSSLTQLQLQASDFSFMPNLSSLVKLEYLELHRLADLTEEPYSTGMKEQFIHQLPSRLSALKLKGRPQPNFSKLKNLSNLCVIGCPISSFPVSQDLIHLRELEISRLESLVEIPDLSLLKSLERLHLNRLNKLVQIRGLSELESLMYLRLSRCPLVEGLPNFSKLDKLQHLRLEDCEKIRAIEGIEGLESWEWDGHGCIVLERSPDVSRRTWFCHRPKCDVFLSFRGLDTHNGISDYLYSSLVHNQISVHIDEDELTFGEELFENLARAIEDSHIYILIFSKSYASSRWCLRELSYIINCTSKSKGEKIILPILYDVDIEDVALRSSSYRSDLRRHKYMGDHDEVKAWEQALKQVSRAKLFDLKTNSLGDVVEWVTAEVVGHLTKINPKTLTVV